MSIQYLKIIIKFLQRDIVRRPSFKERVDVLRVEKLCTTVNKYFVRGPCRWNAKGNQTVENYGRKTRHPEFLQTPLPMGIPIT